MGDGGGARYVHDASDRTSADNNCTVIVASDGARWKIDRRGPVSLRACGAKGDGTTDDTARIRDAFFVQGVAFGDGRCSSFRVNPSTGPISFGDRTTFVGDGRGCSTFVVASLDKPVFELPAYGNSMSRFGMKSATGATQAAGSLFVTLSGLESRISDFFFNGYHQGTLMTGPQARIVSGRYTGTRAGGIVIRAEGGDKSQLIDDVVGGADDPANVAAAGIRVRNSSALVISNTQMINQGTCLLVDPYTATTGASSDAGSVFSMKVANSHFDTCATGARIAVSGGAEASRIDFVNSWTSSATGDGIQAFSYDAASSIKGLTLTAHQSMFNAGSGIVTNGPNVTVTVNGGCIGQNAFAGYFNTGNIIVTGGTIIGPCQGANANGNGLTFASGVTSLLVTGNSFLGQTNNPLVDNTTGLTASQKIKTNNLGL